ncbi:dimethyl sulfoxide reductase anchor subunit family protein [Mobilicoccus pelagius]|uniref:Anaerobic dimethyl sulfoxide reductase subunit C n=1 Tax=Mobilicoccus pelagius NBRC 104925 TaxID=1089455 RepID=H5UMY3_9MICO|nr:DmsC/YnfH family molybdoenzyme membrane anchor subunit [Mobilicoccus pelagius]GAB47091.1 hypothetical protein MOPEL_003_01160 [Mobilicoccus pelagius NBRC 104925]
MNVHELPMILFTVLAQMSAGAFVVLGLIHVGARLSHRYTENDVDRISDPAVLAVGATLVLGLFASMFHMNDVFHVLNVFRHIDSSWLSREIVAGMAFAASGFAYACCQLFRWGSPLLREVLAVLTALLGVVLVVVMSMVYGVLVTVPAWSTWLTTARFATTALLLGAFAVGTAFVTVVMLQRRRAGRVRPEGRDATGTSRVSGIVDRLVGRELTPGAMSLVFASLRAIAVAGIALLAVEILLHLLTLGRLTRLGAVGAPSAAVYTGPGVIAQLVLAVLGAGLLGMFLFRLLGDPATGPRTGSVATTSLGDGAGASRLDAVGTGAAARTGWGRMEWIAALVTVAFGCVFVAEILGRAAFYESMVRVGM